jgi:hypothetical protein
MGRKSDLMTDEPEHPDWIGAQLERMQRALQANAGAPPADQSEVGPMLTKATKQMLIGAGCLPCHAELLQVSERIIATTSIQHAKRFMSDDALWCLIIAGDCGVGKTLAGDWAIQRFFETNDQRFYGSPSRMLFAAPAVREAWFNPEAMNRMQKARLLVVDDLGSEPEDRSGYMSAALFQVVNRRWGHRLKTIITTNLTPSAFKKRYGERAVNRLMDGGECVVVTGASHRNL